MDMRFVSLLDLFQKTADGVNVQVPLGTRSLTMVPSSCAIPVDVYVGGKAGSPKMPGGTLYPGGRLVLAQGANIITVRPLFGLNSGFGWDKSLPLPLPEVDRGATDWSDGTIVRSTGASDASIFSVVDGVIGFLLNADSLDNDSAPKQLPASMRVAALINEGQTAVSCTLGGTGLYATMKVAVPWAVIPMELFRRYTRARLRIVVGQGFTLAATVLQYPVTVYGAPDGLLPTEALTLGVYRSTAAYPNVPGNASSEVIVDCGAPTELAGAMGVMGSTWRNFCYLQRDALTTHCSVRAEWLLDNGESHKGTIEASARALLEVAANSYESLWCYSDGKARLTATAGTVGAGAVPELRLNPVDGVFSGNLAISADVPSAVVIPMPDAVNNNGLGIYSANLPRGNWLVSVFGGGGGFLGRLEVRS